MSLGVLKRDCCLNGEGRVEACVLLLVPPVHCETVLLGRLAKQADQLQIHLKLPVDALLGVSIPLKDAKASDCGVVSASNVQSDCIYARRCCTSQFCCLGNRCISQAWTDRSDRKGRKQRCRRTQCTLHAAKGASRLLLLLATVCVALRE